ncbi:MAG: hypothetical protein Q8O67_32100 [Deltaproteobacteria bacterium]|nr:hypothetical protein [Deltaproteobacteria bacterium]
MSPAVLTIDGGERGERTVPFTVLDDFDEDRPAAPLASAGRVTTGTLTGDTCEPDWPTDVVVIAVDSDDPMAFASKRNGPLLARAIGDGDGVLNLSLYEQAGGDVNYDVVVRDFAGNESPPTTVSTWAGCEGGCASSSSLPVAATLLLLVRRRRGR